MPAALHAAAQAQLVFSNNGSPGRRRAQVEPSLLAVKLFDQLGKRLVPSHARKGERRYRYYVLASLLRPAAARPGAIPAAIDARSIAASSTGAHVSSAPNGWRMPAREIEGAVWSAAAASSVLTRSEGAAAWSRPWPFASMPVNHRNGSDH